MDSSHIVQIIIFIVCIMLSAFFSSSETALMSVNKIRLQNKQEEGNRTAGVVLDLLNDTSKLLGSILVGNNLVNIGASSLATSLSIEFFGSTGVGIATGIVTFLVLVFGEITPKSLAAQRAESIALFVAKPIKFIVILLHPITTVLLKITNALIRIFGGSGEERSPFVTPEELIALVNVGHEEGVLEEGEKVLLENVFDFKSSQVKNVMTPRTDVVAIDVEIAYEDLLSVFRDEQYSRIPVYEGTIDKIIGILHVRDFIDIKLAGAFFDVRKHMREVYWTYEYQNTTMLLQEMRKAQLYLAVVLDEYGGTAGIITLEDIVEEIIGEIEDEYDVAYEDITPTGVGTYNIEGSAKMDDINDVLGTTLPTEEDYDTISGFIFSILGHIPEEGEELVYENTRFTIEQMDKNRIEKITVDHPIAQDTEVEMEES